MAQGDSNRITRKYLDSISIELRHIDTDIPSTVFSLYGITRELAGVMGRTCCKHIQEIDDSIIWF